MLTRHISQAALRALLGVAGLVAGITVTSGVHADDLVRPTPVPTMVQPAQYREIPTNARFQLVTTSSADTIQAEWPSALPTKAPPGWTAVLLNHQNGTRVTTTVTKWPVPGGTMVQIAPSAPLDPETQYDILAAVAQRDPSRPVSGEPIAVETKFVARIITGAGPDTAAPAWPGPGEVQLRTVVNAEGRYGCQAYLEEITFTTSGLDDQGTVPRNLRVRLEPAAPVQGARPRPSVALTPKTDHGSLRVSSCDGTLAPWTGRPGQAVGSFDRVVHVYAEDLAGNKSPTYVVTFPAHTGNAGEWSTAGQVQPLEAPAPAAEAEAESEEAAREGGGANPIILVAALVVLAGVAFVVARRKRG